MKNKKIPKCMYNVRGKCARDLEAYKPTKKCPGQCEYYLTWDNYIADYRKDYPIIEEGNGFSGMKEGDYD